MFTKILLLDFSCLEHSSNLTRSFNELVQSAVMQKFQGTGVVITTDPLLAFSYGPDSEVVQAFVHDGEFDFLSGSARGAADPHLQFAEVNVNDFSVDSTDALAKQVGTVLSHEAGHVFLPDGHSIDHTNLMNTGPDLEDELASSNGDSLGFTEFQKSILRCEIQPPDGYSLARIENGHLELGVTEKELASFDLDDLMDDDTDSTDDGYSDLDLDTA